MKKTIPLIALSFVLCFSVALFTGCNGGQGSSQAAGSQGAAAAEEREIPREEVEKLVADALAQEFTTVGFTMETRTTATAKVEGKTQSQASRTLMKGELSKAQDDPWVHMSYEAESNMQVGRQKYDMYMSGDDMVIVQNGEMFANPVNKEDAAKYSNSLVQVTSEEEIGKMLDVARSCKLETTEDNVKTVTITVDVDKIEEVGLVDTSTLPEGSSVATLVVNYTFDADSHFKSVRLMSSTKGTPTYRVTQTYDFYNYDQVQKPEWPDYESYVMDKTGIKKDADGRLYIEGDDGTPYYIESIDEDGTIHFIMPSSGSTAQPQQQYYYDYTAGSADDGGNAQPQQSQTQQSAPNTSTNANNNASTNTNANTNTNNNANNTSSNNNTSNQGRAYITGYDGKQYFLDDPTSEIVDLGSGVKALRTADGGFYILNMDGAEDAI